MFHTSIFSHMTWTDIRQQSWIWQLQTWADKINTKHFGTTSSQLVQEQHSVSSQSAPRNGLSYLCYDFCLLSVCCQLRKAGTSFFSILMVTRVIGDESRTIKLVSWKWVMRTFMFMFIFKLNSMFAHISTYFAFLMTRCAADKRLEVAPDQVNCLCIINTLYFTFI